MLRLAAKPTTHLVLFSHAVVCDGQSMQRMPGSLRLLTKLCQDAKVPLYILNDSRSWGQQTHANLDDVLVDMKKTVSNNVVGLLLMTVFLTESFP